VSGAARSRTLARRAPTCIVRLTIISCVLSPTRLMYFRRDRLLSGRPGGRPPRPPIDPDVRNSRIRLLEPWVRCVQKHAPCGETHPLSAPHQLCYPFKFRADDFGAQCLHRRSLQWFHDSVPPSLHGVPRDGSPASTVQWSTLTSCDPRLARLRFAQRFHLAVEAAGSPRFLGSPCVRALASDPGGSSRQALREGATHARS
jgi:hypothetical protein